jgi:hypothetical protein
MRPKAMEVAYSIVEVSCPLPARYLHQKAQGLTLSVEKVEVVDMLEIF